MAVPRPLLLTLLGMVLLAGAFMATRGSNSAVEKAAAPAASAQKQAAPAPKPAELSPQDAIRAIANPGKPLNSARFDMRLESRELGGKRQTDFVRMSGRFGPRDGAKRDFVLRSREPGQSVEISSADGRTFYRKGSTAYELEGIDKGLAAFKKALAGGPEAAKAPGLDPVPWMRRLKAEDNAKIEGVDTVHVSGIVDGTRMARDLRRFARTAAPGGEQGSGLPPGFGKKVDQAFDGAKLDAYVGKDDRIVRRVRVAVTGRIPAEMLAQGATPRWRSVFELSLSGVNRPQEVQAPTQLASKPLPKRARAEAENAYAGASVLVDPPAGVAQTAVGFIRLGSLAEARRVPRLVSAAMKANKRVVIFFFQRRGVDDPITGAAVNGLRRRSSAAVFIDRVDNVAAYGQIVQSVGVSRAPSVVIIGRDEKARLIQGYVDPETLAQEVADTR